MTKNKLASASLEADGARRSIGQMAVIIAVIIAVLGWIITHALTIRAQNKNFINQVINHARLEITKAIRQYQDWLGKVQTRIQAINYDLILQDQAVSVDWLHKRAELTEILFSDRRAVEWIFRLEENEILFPETADCRKDLVDRQHQISEYLHSLMEQLPSGLGRPPDFDRRKESIKKALQNDDALFDQMALMEDLRVYLQNLCLSSFTGNRIPERKPDDPTLPRLVQDAGGKLQITVVQNTTKDGRS
jgi:hypothetical protein